MSRPLIMLPSASRPEVMPEISSGSLRPVFRLRVKGPRVVGSARILSLLLPAPASSVEQEPALPFRVGVRLTFQISWFGIPAGNLKSPRPGAPLTSGHPSCASSLRSGPNKTFSLFYPVDDRFKSLWDPVERHPLFYRLRQREGFYRIRKRIGLDRENKFAFCQRNNDPAWGYVIRYGAQDALSTFYRLRSMKRAPVRMQSAVMIIGRVRDELTGRPVSRRIRSWPGPSAEPAPGKRRMKERPEGSR